MSFGRWRQQLHIRIALQRLDQGASVQTVALDLGYDGASAFVTMFRKAPGKPPARHLAERRIAVWLSALGKPSRALTRNRNILSRLRNAVRRAISYPGSDADALARRRAHSNGDGHMDSLSSGPVAEVLQRLHQEAEAADAPLMQAYAQRDGQCPKQTITTGSSRPRPRT